MNCNSQQGIAEATQRLGLPMTNPSKIAIALCVSKNEKLNFPFCTSSFGLYIPLKNIMLNPLTL